MELNQAIQFFLTNYFQRKRLSERTYQSYKNELNKFYQFLKENESSNSIEMVEKKSIDYYLNECSKSLPLTKLNAVASHLRCFFSFLKKERIIEDDPTHFMRHLPVGTILRYEDTTNFLSGLNNSLKKLGKEQYKFQAVIESRKEKEWELFNELKRRLNRNERLLEKVVGIKNELQFKISSDFIKELLPVMDGLEEAIAQISSLNTHPDNPEANPNLKGLMKKLLSINPISPDLNQWRDGLNMIHDRLIQILQKANVTAMKSIGEKFNPHEHIAVAVEERDDFEENIIIKEHLKGYRQGNEIIRLAEVVVARRTGSDL